MIGVPVTMPGFNALIGENCLILKQQYDVAVGVNTWLLAHPPVNVGDAMVDPLTVEPFSYSEEEAATIRSAYGDLAYQKAAAFDTSTHVKKIYGVGQVIP